MGENNWQIFQQIGNYTPQTPLERNRQQMINQKFILKKSKRK